MATEISDNSLSWVANIDYTSQLPGDIKAIEEMLKKLGVGVLSAETIALPVVEAEKKIQETVKATAGLEIKLQEEVAAKTIELDNEVAANQEKINENWRMQHDDQMQALFAYQDELAKTGFKGSIVQTEGLKSDPVKLQKEAFGLDDDLLRILNEAKAGFASLDAETRAYVEELIELEVELQKIKEAQKGVDAAREKGSISNEEYTKSTAALAAQEKSIGESIELITQRQKDLDAINSQSLSFINQKKESLKQLKQAYDSLSESEVKSDVGKKMAAEIQTLSSEIRGLNPEKLKEVKEKTVTAFTELRKLKNEMASNPQSPMFDTWRLRAKELQESLETVRNELKLATSDSSGIDALATGVRGLVGGFTAAAGAVSLFAGENQEAEEAIRKTTGALAVLNGIQELSRVLEKESALNVFLLGKLRKADAAATALQTAATSAQTVATTGAAAATRALTTAMLANPAGAVLVAITALVTAYVLFKKKVDETRTAQELLTQAGEKVNNSYAEQQAKLLPYLEALKSANVTEKQRVEIYEKLREINPDIVNGIDAKTLSYEKLITNVDLYLESLRQQIALEINAEATRQSVVQETEIKKKIAAQQKLVDAYKQAKEAEQDQSLRTFGSGVIEVAGSNVKEGLDNLTESLEKQKEVTKQLAVEGAGLVLSTDKKTAAVKRGTDAIDKDIAEQKRQQAAFAETSAEYQMFKEAIIKLEKEREGITGKSDKALKESSKLENELNAILEKRKDILQGIASLERSAQQSGMLKEASEVDKINEKYDDYIIRLKEANHQIEKYNATHKKKVDPISKAEFNRVELARATEVANQQYREEAKIFLSALEQKKQAFEKYQNAIDSGNIQIADKAKDIYGNQVGDFKDYLSFLQKEMFNFLPKVLTGKLNVGDLKIMQGLNQEIQKEKERLNEKNSEQELQQFTKLIESAKGYHAKRLDIEEKYNKEFETLQKNRSELSEDQLTTSTNDIQKRKNDEIAALDETTEHAMESYKKLSEEIIASGRKVLRIRIQQLKEHLTKLEESVGKESAIYKEREKDLTGLQNALLDQNLATFEKFAAIAGQLGQHLSDANGDLSVMGDIMQGLVSQAGNLSIAMSENSTNEEKIGAGLSAVTDLVGIIISSAQERKRAEEAYYQSVIGQQQQYNLLLNDQIGLQSELNENVFVNDFQGRLVGGFDQLRDASDKYQDSLKALLDGQAKLGQQNAISWGNVAAGAGAGAVIGTIVPGIGNVIGAVVGAVVGGVVALFAAKKKKDIFGDLVTQYPELIKESANGWEELNVELAQTLIDQNLVDEKTKQLLQTTIDWTKQIEKAKDQMKGVISDLAGNLGDDIRNSLVQAFKDGTDAAEAFGNSVSKTLEDMLSQLLFNQVFSKAFDTLEEEMLNSFDFGGDSNWVDDFGRFFSQAEVLTETFNQGLADAVDAADAFNLDVFKSNAGSQTANTLSGAIRGISEQQADLLAGQFGGLRMTAIDQLKIATQQLEIMNDIRYNTSFIEMMHDVVKDNYQLHKKWDLNGLKVQ